MNCPKCNSDSSGVFNSRPIPGGGGIRRRRRCDVCDHRFSTIELKVGAIPGMEDYSDHGVPSHFVSIAELVEGFGVLSLQDRKLLLAMLSRLSSQDAATAEAA